MAMKFWFGKKETEQEGRSGVSCDVLAIPDHACDNAGLTAQNVFGAPQQGSVTAESQARVSQPLPLSGALRQESGVPLVISGRVESAVLKSADSGLGPVPVPPVAVDAPVSGVAAPVIASVGVDSPAESQRAVLKSIGATARVEVRPAAGAAAATQAVGLKSVGPLAQGVAGAGRPTFGLRSRTDLGESPALSAPPAAGAPPAGSALSTVGVPLTAKEKGVVERDVDAVVRPKVDQKALYYQLMNGLYDAVLILDNQGHVVDCNSRVTEMLGYLREEAWDLPVEKVITGMTSQMFEHLKRNLAENHHILIDARCFRKEGTSFAGEVGVSTLSLTRGTNIVFAIRNVERRKSAMDELRKSHAALDIALAPAFVCDTDGFFIVVNSALLEAFGIPDEVQAKSVRFMDLLPDAARLFLRASCGEKLRETLRVPTPDGLPVKLQLALMPIQSGQSVTGVAGSILQM